MAASEPSTAALQRDVMGDRRAQLRDGRDASAATVRSDASGATRPRTNGTGCSDKAFRLDGGRAIDDVGRHMHLEAGRARRACHRQAMRQEIPVLGDDVEQPQQRLRPGRQAAPARSRSWKCTMPTGRPASTTIRAVIFAELRISSASLAS